ncbi:glycosyltransferase family 25 protein [Vibrio sp. SM6]|uniref:Glycosyltransferase family 25 protein n=1 Tax=Vibrio agarilyticus TaxID=2726741 RepID=A0A7X8YHP0_9VIBR|nr:glycosyltransferase family 25 protein [Vibrio agarilyticus]NLS13552.1 glycosyltransferase family 25 protein [Vibrio agarilyticus]
MKVFVISLFRSTERRKRMIEKMAEAEIEFEFFDAIDAAQSPFTYSERYNDRLTRLRKGYSLLSSEVACFASHLALWQHCVAIDEPILVIEDNVDISPNAKNVIDKVDDIIAQFEFIKLSATKRGKFHSFLPLTLDYSLGGFAKGTTGATSYAISPSAALNLSQHAVQFIEPVDDYMEKPWRHHIQTYSIQPSLFTRASVSSTIGSHRKDKSKITFFDKIFIESFRTYEWFMRLLYWKNKQ